MIEDDAALPTGGIVAMRTFNNVAIGQRADGYLNATAMCRANGKEWFGYARTAETKAFLNELSSALDIPVEAKPQISGIQQNQSLIWSKQGAAEHGGGTWVHPQVAYHLAQWCSPAFAVQVTEWIHDIRTKGYAMAPGVTLAADGVVSVAAIQALTSAVREVTATVATLRAEVTELRICRDPRLAGVTDLSQRQLLDNAKVPSKGRHPLNRKFSYHLPRLAIAAGVLPKTCPHSHVLLYPVEFADKFMKEYGNAWIADHLAKMNGQMVFNFEDEKKKRRKNSTPDEPPPDDSAS